MTINVLYFDGCPSYPVAVELLEKLLGEEGLLVPVRRTQVSSREAAIRERFLGSPTIRINGEDVEPAARARTDFGLKCRLYPVDSRLVGIPAESLLRAAIRTAKRGELEKFWSGTTEL